MFYYKRLVSILFIEFVYIFINTSYYFLFCIVCDNSTYGSNCVHNCSRNCLNNSPCNKETGYCKAGCNPGYTNALCNQGKLMFLKILFIFKVI